MSYMSFSCIPLHIIAQDPVLHTGILTNIYKRTIIEWVIFVPNGYLHGPNF